jgi:phospholipid transport system substrate-binding protein
MKSATLSLVLILASVFGAAHASSSDPAVVKVQALTGMLLRVMHAGPGASTGERCRELAPVIEQVFALPLMTRLSVGPAWAKWSPEQQKALITAFSRYTIMNYARNFGHFDGQKFEVDDNVVNRGPEKIVRSRLIPQDGSPANLLYRALKVDGTWKIIDVYYDGVSELTLHRADFAGAVATGGAPALIAYLNHVSNGPMK